MNTEQHAQKVVKQFGSKAHGYLTSSVHAQGEDLAALVEIVGLNHEARILDLGCGAGHVAFNLAPLVSKVVAYDLSEDMLAVVAQEAKRRDLPNIKTQIGAVECLPYADESFDWVVTRLSAHHWLNVAGGLSEINRVLKPNGFAVIIDLLSPGVFLLDTWLQTIELLRDTSHVRNLSLAEWHALIAAAGLKVLRVNTFRRRLEFASWVGRMQAPEHYVMAIRSLQQCASTEVAKYFAFESDGSFTSDTALIVASK